MVSKEITLGSGFRKNSFFFAVFITVFFVSPAFLVSQENSLDVLTGSSIQGEYFMDGPVLKDENVDFYSDYPSDILSRTLVSRMSDAEKLSQILMFGWAGQEPPELLFQWVGEVGLGSVKIFGWNTEDIKLVAKSITALQKSAVSRRFKIPLFVATDQEGGWIRHVKGETLVTPGNMAIGASGYPCDAWYSAYYISREIRALGINMNFAPPVDIFTNQDSTIIGTRSFGTDAKKVGILGGAWASGSEAAGVIPTAKHFPGHGATEYDSHGTLPVINIDFKTFRERELSPFIYLINNNIPAIMSGHLAFPKIDSTGAPASLSKYFLTELLRGELGYKGLIITDDMMMNGDTMYAGSLSKAFRMAIEAGNDIIISSKMAKLEDAHWLNNLALMKTDPAFRARVEDSAVRVVKAKIDYFRSAVAAPLYPNPDTLDKYIPDPEGKKFFLEQACRSISPVKTTLIPLSEEKAGKILLVGGLPKFFEEGKKRFPSSKDFKFTYEIGPNETQWVCDNLPAVAQGFDTIILCVHNERTAKIAESIRNLGKNVVILSIMTPSHGSSLKWAGDIVAGYSYSDYTMAALFGGIAGEYQMQGMLP